MVPVFSLEKMPDSPGLLKPAEREACPIYDAVFSLSSWCLVAMQRCSSKVAVMLLLMLLQIFGQNSPLHWQTRELFIIYSVLFTIDSFWSMKQRPVDSTAYFRWFRTIPLSGTLQNTASGCCHSVNNVLVHPAFGVCLCILRVLEANFVLLHLPWGSALSAL